MTTTGSLPDTMTSRPIITAPRRTWAKSIVDLMRKTYVPNTAVLICPITRLNFGQTWLNYASMSNFADTTTKDYGGWDTTASYVFTPYMWLANLTPLMKYVDATGKVNPDPYQNEPAWPTKTPGVRQPPCLHHAPREQDPGLEVLGRGSHGRL